MTLPVRPAPLAHQAETLARRAVELGRAAKAANTRKAYAGDWSRFSQWCAGLQLTALPAARFAEYLWWTLGEAQTRADRGLSFVPLDLNALRPIPRKILYAGWHAAGAEWCWSHWGTRLPLRRVKFYFDHRRHLDSAGIEVAAVYAFLSGDWSPWRSLATWQRKWPALKFNLQPNYGEQQAVNTAVQRAA